MNLKSLYEKYQKYLPSKKFMYIFVCIVIIGVVFIFSKSNKNEILTVRGEKSAAALKIENQTINDLIEKDTDGDGVPDWEETLWGTDKNVIRTFGNVPDATYIDNKKKELNIEQSVNVMKLTETEKFAREFFTSFSAMKTSGEVDQDTINSFSNALGQKIVNPTLTDVYTEANVKIDEGKDSNDINQQQKYYNTVKKLYESYQSSGIGDELDIINSGLALSTTTSPKQFDKLPIIAKAYQDFAKKLMALSVPSDLANYHLNIANDAHNTGTAVASMKEIINDPLIGLQGLSQYQKYSEDLVKSVEDLQTYLAQNNDTITE